MAPPVGSLRQRAVTAAHRLLDAHGEPGVALRLIAAELNTGVGSLYYHFASKDALLAELAVDGFAELGRWMAMAAAAPSKSTAFLASGHAYLGYIRHRPALYALMYNERILAAFEGVRDAETAAFEIFRRSLDGQGYSDTDASDLALAFWVMARGLASISSRFGGAKAAGSRQMVMQVLHGLALLAKTPLAGLSAGVEG
jgi:AcrR family transcriptional regulator